MTAPSLATYIVTFKGKNDAQDFVQETLLNDGTRKQAIDDILDRLMSRGDQWDFEAVILEVIRRERIDGKLVLGDATDEIKVACLEQFRDHLSEEYNELEADERDVSLAEYLWARGIPDSGFYSPFGIDPCQAPKDYPAGSVLEAAE